MKDLEKENRETWQKGMSGQAHQTAAPAEGKGEGKGKDKGENGGKGKSRSNSQTPKGQGKQNGDKKFCWFFNFGTCQKGVDCTWSHDTPPKAMLESMQNGRAQSPTPKGGGKKGGGGKDENGKRKGKGRGKAKAAPAPEVSATGGATD